MRRTCRPVCGASVADLFRGDIDFSHTHVSGLEGVSSDILRKRAADFSKDVGRSDEPNVLARCLGDLRL
jgi:hypothetical protein